MEEAMPYSPRDPQRRIPPLNAPRYIRTLGLAFLLPLLLFYSLVAARSPRRSPPPILSETGLYSDISSKTVARPNMMFSPQYPLWSDGAKKKRWIYIPPRRTIDANHADDWVFPVGTKFWKEFSFGKRVETRYLEKSGEKTWMYATYAWKEDGSDAVLVPPEGLPNHVEIVPGVRHDIPGTDGCRACHEGQGRDVVLGFNALQLSPLRDPNAPHTEPFTPEMVNLDTLARRKLLAHFPARLLAHPPEIAGRSPRERAALGYLSGNCGGCHNTTDPLSSVGMYLKRSVNLLPGEMWKELESVIGHRSKYQVPGTGPDESYRIAPGHPEQSTLLFRMSTRNIYRQMPPLGTKIVDTLAVALIANWIQEDLTKNSGTAHFIHH